MTDTQQASDEEIAALKAGLEGVTPGPWRMHVPDRGYCSNYLLTDAPGWRGQDRRGRCYADGETHTNSIEGFWSLLKRAWYGSHHHYTKGYMPLFVAESCWKYNQRRNADPFAFFVKGCFA